MKAYGHDDGCDGRHTPRQRCNTRAHGDAPGVAVVALDPLPEQMREPASESDLTAGEQREGEAGAPAAEAAVAIEARDAAAGRPAPDVAAARTLSRRAVADGPLDTIDTRGLPIAPIAGVAALGAACAVVAWRVLLARKR